MLGAEATVTAPIRSRCILSAASCDIQHSRLSCITTRGLPDSRRREGRHGLAAAAALVSDGEGRPRCMICLSLVRILSTPGASISGCLLPAAC